jgi:hypothetical protein
VLSTYAPLWVMATVILALPDKLQKEQCRLITNCMIETRRPSRRSGTGDSRRCEKTGRPQRVAASRAILACRGEWIGRRNVSLSLFLLPISVMAFACKAKLVPPKHHHDGMANIRSFVENAIVTADAVHTHDCCCCSSSDVVVTETVLRRIAYVGCAALVAMLLVVVLLMPPPARR